MNHTWKKKNKMVKCWDIWYEARGKRHTNKAGAIQKTPFYRDEYLQSQWPFWQRGLGEMEMGQILLHATSNLWLSLNLQWSLVICCGQTYATDKRGCLWLLQNEQTHKGKLCQWSFTVAYLDNLHKWHTTETYSRDYTVKLVAAEIQVTPDSVTFHLMSHI